MNSDDCPVCQKWVERCVAAGGVLPQDECELQTIHFSMKHLDEQLDLVRVFYDDAQRWLDGHVRELKQKHGLT